jgi:hypothetical protein
LAIVERSGLNSTDVLATLFDQEMTGLVQAAAGQAIQQSVVVGKMLAAGLDWPQNLSPQPHC